MQQILDEWKDIDILINNVGISKFSSITETSVEDFDKILSVNLRPVFITSRLLPFIVRDSLILILMEESLISAQHVI